MQIAEQLRILKDAQGDPAKLALATVDIAFPALPVDDRDVLKETLAAAAVPHWFDEDVLTALMDITAEEGRERHAQLRRLSLVELFPARGRAALNVHEASRLALRKSLARERPDQFRSWSERMAGYFGQATTPAARVEHIFHRSCSAPDDAASELESLNRDWSSAARPEDRQALAVALQELIASGLMHRRGLLWGSLCVAWARSARGHTAQLSDDALRALELARDLRDPAAESDAQCLLGDALQAQGKLGAAQAAFAEYLAISRQLAAQDPSNASWQRELAVAHNRVGDVLQAQGELEAAQAAFAETLLISRALAAQDPSNAGWQRDLAVAQSCVGDVLQAQGKLEAAQTAFAECLAISRALAAQDPSNAGWQRDLAVAQGRVGDVLHAQGKLEAAQAAFAENLAISRRLAEQDPSNAGWQRDLAVAQSYMGDVLHAQRKLEAAQTAFVETLMISRRLAEQDPSNADWQRDLAVAQIRVGDVLQAQGELHAAQAAFEETLKISCRLAEQDPSNADWQRDLAVAHNRVGRVLQAQGKLEAAQAALAKDLAISRGLAERDPSNAGWQRDLAVAHSRVGDVLQAQGKLEAAQSAFVETLAISRRLAEQAPSNAGWQRELAVAHNRLGDILQAKGEVAGALQQYDLAVEGYHRPLGERDPATLAAVLKLLASLVEIGQIRAARKLVAERVLWLLSSEVEMLPAELQGVRAQIDELVAQSTSKSPATSS